MFLTWVELMIPVICIWRRELSYLAWRAPIIAWVESNSRCSWRANIACASAPFASFASASLKRWVVGSYWLRRWLILRILSAVFGVLNSVFWEPVDGVSCRGKLSWYGSYDSNSSVISLELIGQRPVNLNPSLIVCGWKVFRLISPIEYRNSSFENLRHPVIVAASTASLCQCLYTLNTPTSRGCSIWLVWESKKNKMILFFSQNSMNWR